MTTATKSGFELEQENIQLSMELDCQKNKLRDARLRIEELSRQLNELREAQASH